MEDTGYIRLSKHDVKILYDIYNKSINEFLELENELKIMEKDIRNIVSILKNNTDDLEATEEEFESLFRWDNNENK